MGRATANLKKNWLWPYCVQKVLKNIKCANHKKIVTKIKMTKGQDKKGRVKSGKPKNAKDGQNKNTLELAGQSKRRKNVKRSSDYQLKLSNISQLKLNEICL